MGDYDVVLGMGLVDCESRDDRLSCQQSYLSCVPGEEEFGFP